MLQFIRFIRSWFVSNGQQKDPLLQMQLAAEHKASIRNAEEAMEKVRTMELWAADIEAHRPLVSSEQDKLAQVYAEKDKAMELMEGCSQRRVAAM